jgi:two-component system NarL family sensor kinase
MLLECDSCGHLLWMSERPRLALGRAENLRDAIVAGNRSQPDAWMPAAVSAGREETAALLRLESSLLRHCLRLQRAERDLSAFARQRRRGSGRGALRQIELERQRLGRELHTGLGQMLAAIRLQLEIVAALLPDPPSLVQQALSRISTLANEALEHVRSVSGRLHPPEWQRLILETALQQLWDLSGIPHRLEASLRIQPLPHEPDLEVKVLMYRAAQEALSNVARHARATRVDAALETRDDCLILTIRDDGVGFDVAGLLRGPASVASGIGLRSIREQAAALGGKLEIESGPSGTKLVVSAPFS